jgi:hypothetical protein
LAADLTDALDQAEQQACPQFDLSDPRISDWASGRTLEVDMAS